MKITALDIYQAYPRHVARKPAITAIEKAIKAVRDGGRDEKWLLDMVNAYAESTRSFKDKQFIPYPATWFNAERYYDDVAEWKATSGNGSRVHGTGTNYDDAF